MRITNRTKERLICSRAVRADTFRRRALGLMFRREWKAWDGMFLSPCSAIHTFFMRMPIDLCFLGPDGEVIKTVSGMRPWRLARGGSNSRDTLELPIGTLKREETEPGDHLVFE